MGKKKLSKAATSLSVDPNASDLTILFQQGRFIEIVSAYRNLSDNPASDPGAAFILAASLFRLNEFAQTLSILDKLTGSLDGDDAFHSLCGAACRRLGLINRATQHFTAALRLNPNNPDSQNNFANLLIDQGKTAQAREILESLLRAHPSHVDARANLNRLDFIDRAAVPQTTKQAAWTPEDPLLSAFRTQQTASQGRQQPRPNSQSLPINLPQGQPEQIAFEQIKLVASALTEKKFEFALQLLSSAHSNLSVVNPDIYINAADVYIRLQKFSEAEACLLHALAMGAYTFANYLNLVSLTLMRRDLKLAVFYLNKAAQIDPANSKLPLLRQQISVISSQEGANYQFKPTWSSPQVVKHSA